MNNYFELGYNNFLSRQSNQEDLSEGINSSNAEALIAGGAISFGKTSIAKLAPKQDIETSDFKTGSTGWKIYGDGSVEFNKGSFRGTITLAGSEGSLDDISDGVNYAKVLSTSISAGQILLSQASGDSDDLLEGASNFFAGTSGADFVKAIDTLDDVENGTSFARVLSTDISAGHILLSSVSGDLDDVGDGVNYAKVLTTSISSGKILLSKTDGDLDDISNGTNYGKVALTNISAGNIVLQVNQNLSSQGISIKSSASYPYVRIYPDSYTGIDVVDNVGKTVFKASIGGTNVGDVQIGDYGGGQGLLYDKSAGEIKYKNVQWSAVVDDDTNKPDNNADVTGDNTANDTTRVQGNIILDISSNIKAGHLTADNITTGTLDASLVTVDNLNAGNITAGTLVGRTIQSSSGYDKIVLDNGDYLKFYAGGYLRASLRGTTSGNGGIMNTGSFYVPAYEHFSAEGDTGYFTSLYTASKSGILSIPSNSSGNFKIMDDDSSSHIMRFSYYDIISHKTIVPDTTFNASGTFSLGSASAKWDDVMCYALKGPTSQIWLDQPGRVQVTNHLDPTGTAVYNLGGTARYWNDVHCVDVKYHSLVDYKDGVELNDRSKVSNLEALSKIKRSRRKQKDGDTYLDKKSFPKKIYSPAPIAEEDIYEEKKNEKTKKRRKVLKYKKGQKIGEDSISEVKLMSSVIGALKEANDLISDLNKRVESLENKLKKK